MTDRHKTIALFVPHAGCSHQCAFCNQKHIAGQTSPVTPDDVLATCHAALETIADGTHTEIAFFGGSFTAIPRDQMESLLQAAFPFVQRSQVKGIRLSTRPDAIDDEVLVLLKSYGVTAIELGAQSMDDTVLCRAGRGHDAACVAEAAHRVRAHGFSLGLQMMTGLPGATEESDRSTAQALATLRPDTMRVYPTLVLEHTPLAAMYRAGDYRPQTERQAIELGAWLLRYFEIEQGIRVIRMGLQDEPDLKQHLLAGPFLPAFREHCENQLYLETALATLPPSDGSTWRLTVHPSAVSKMIGQRRRNIETLHRLGYRVTVTGSESVPVWDIMIEKGT